MKKLIASLLSVVGLFACLGVASAQTYIIPLKETSVGGNPVNGPVAFDVTLVQTGNQFVITSITGNGAGADNVSQVSMSFWSGPSGSGSLVPGIFLGPGGPGTGTSGVVGTPTGLWSSETGPATSLNFNTLLVPGLSLMTNGTNSFTFGPGSYVVVNGERSISFVAQDGASYTGNVNLTPEASSLLLLLAALAPLGLLAWRRRAAFSRMA
jgi:hypothetical protein